MIGDISLFSSKFGVNLAVLGPVIVVVLGAILTHQFALWRDRVAKRREIRLNHLLEAFKLFSTAMNKHYAGCPLEQVVDDVNLPLFYMQVLGEAKLVNSATNFVEALVEATKTLPNGSWTPENAMNALREEIRIELKLKPAEEKFHWIVLKNPKPPCLTPQIHKGWVYSSSITLPVLAQEETPTTAF